MIIEVPQSWHVCRAKKYRGGICIAAPTSGKKRCHAHGGAPRTGAPRGNGNALTHGGYRHGLWRLDKAARKHLREMTAEERERVPRLRRDARAIAAGQARAANPAASVLARTWDGKQVRGDLLSLKSALEADLLKIMDAGNAVEQRDLVAIDVLHLLCRDTLAFASLERFADKVCQLFLAIDAGNWRGRDGYYIEWRNFCAELYANCWPLVAGVSSAPRNCNSTDRTDPEATLKTVDDVRPAAASAIRDPAGSKGNSVAARVALEERLIDHDRQQRAAPANSAFASTASEVERTTATEERLSGEGKSEAEQTCCEEEMRKVLGVMEEEYRNFVGQGSHPDQLADQRNACVVPA